MSDNQKRYPREEATTAERRRVAKVVHDDRGNASVEWCAAPTNHERPVLKVLGEGGLTLKTEEVSYDPYSSYGTPKSGGAKRTDLRRLSEWIKRMREIEERKRDSGDAEK